jgi:hypothetical protein
MIYKKSAEKFNCPHFDFLRKDISYAIATIANIDESNTTHFQQLSLIKII